eukprot:scaffold892_cov104-Cylindrotheca_fusiformis.AAC.2
MTTTTTTIIRSMKIIVSQAEIRTRYFLAKILPIFGFRIHCMGRLQSIYIVRIGVEFFGRLLTNRSSQLSLQGMEPSWHAGSAG